MDPNVTLAHMRAAIIAYTRAQRSDMAQRAEMAAAEAIAAIIALDSWLSMGGYLPVVWQAKRNGSPESKQPES